MSDEQWLTPSEYAAKFRVDARTVRRWAKTGKVQAERTPGGQWRILPPTTTEGDQP